MKKVHILYLLLLRSTLPGILMLQMLAAQDLFGDQNVITTAADQAYSVYAIDIDADGDMDVLSASIYDDKIAWYENNVECEGEFDCNGECGGSDMESCMD